MEKHTRCQVSSDLWHQERKLRITASMVKEVCCKRGTTSIKSFILKELAPKSIDTAAICYGNDHEQDAIESYKRFCKSNGKEVVVESCGLVISLSEPWLAASPDGIVSEGGSKGCLEVKCPFLCK